MNMTVNETRRNNLRAIIEKQGGVSKLARQMGYTNPSFLSQMAGPAAEIALSWAQGFRGVNLAHTLRTVVRRRPAAGRNRPTPCRS